MGVPTEEELKQALAKAAEMRESDKDEDFIAKSLLNLNFRFDKASRLISQMKQYLHSGESAVEHAKLVKAIDEFERVSRQSRDDPNFGLR